MLRILLVSISDYKGGMERHVVDLAQELKNRGHDVALVCGSGFSNRLTGGIKVFEINSRRYRYSPALILDTLKAIMSFKPNIIHCHGSKATQLVAFLPPLNNMARVATIHGLKKVIRAYQKFDACIGVSQAVTDRLKEKGIRCVTIYNGIETPSSKQTVLTEPDILWDHPAPFCWALIGRLVSVKGFDLALHALAKTEHHALIVGEGPEEEHLKLLANSLGIKSRVKFLGYCSNINEIYNVVDGTLITSHREGFSYVFLESMMSGKPVVSTDVPVANEILPKRFICLERSPIILASIMNDLAGMPSRSDVQQEQIHLCRSQLTLATMTRKTEELYFRTLANS